MPLPARRGDACPARAPDAAVAAAAAADVAGEAAGEVAGQRAEPTSHDTLSPQTSCRRYEAVVVADQAGPAFKKFRHGTNAEQSEPATPQFDTTTVTPPGGDSGPAGPFDLAAYLGRTARAVEAALDRYVPRSPPPHPSALSDAMRHSLLAGGKRIRPALVIAACEMVGGTQEMAMPTACALEMVHTMSLIHDDLPMMDNDDLRRGRPACHRVYGEAVALLAGDALLAQAFALVARESAGVPPDRIVRCIALLGPLLGAEGLAGGQVADLAAAEQGGAVPLAAVEYIHQHKTAALVVAAVCTGACIGGAGDAALAALRSYGTKLGLAYQIVDDVLDASGTAQELGKAVGKDAAAGKATYVRALGVEAAQAMAERLVGEARAALAAYGPRAAPLLALADFAVARRR